MYAERGVGWDGVTSVSTQNRENDTESALGLHTARIKEPHARLVGSDTGSPGGFTHPRRHATVKVDHSPGDAFDLVQQPLQKLVQEHTALLAAHARARRARELIFLFTVLLIAIGSFAFYRHGSRLREEAYAQQLAT